MALNILLILIALACAAFLILSPKLKASSDWQATVTPLASIMGSGFLVSAPLLASSVGNYAVLCMAGLLLLAYWVGGVIRFNIAYFEPIAETGRGITQIIGFTSRIALSIAYLISVTYYLKLLSAFLLSMMQIDSPLAANVITSSLLAFIALVGVLKGLDLLEKIEKFAVSINLSVILALLVALVYYNSQQAFSGEWHLAPLWPEFSSDKVRILLGLLIVVQGFETSRYIGKNHSPEQRIRTMRYAQWISSAIYLVFLALATILFTDSLSSDVTGIITMVAPIALVLPILLSIAAMGSQFSAAVADNSGAGGLIEEILLNKISLKVIYIGILLTALTMTWLTNVNEIIAYASRGFAFYYFLQAIVAFIVALQKGHGFRFKAGSFLVIGVVCFAVFVFGIPAE
jgi:hypothetical protein